MSWTAARFCTDEVVRPVLEISSLLNNEPSPQAETDARMFGNICLDAVFWVYLLKPALLNYINIRTVRRRICIFVCPLPIGYYISARPAPVVSSSFSYDAAYAAGSLAPSLSRALSQYLSG
jgi:hypothetical protein